MGYIANIYYFYPPEKSDVDWLSLTLNTERWPLFLKYCENCSVKDDFLPGTYLYTMLKCDPEAEENDINLEYDSISTINEKLANISDLLSKGLVAEVILATHGDKNLARHSFELDGYIEELAKYCTDTAFVYGCEGYEGWSYQGFVIQNGKMIFSEYDDADILEKKILEIISH